MDAFSLNDLELIRIAPVSMIVILLIYFGWWLRGESVRLLKEWIDELKRQ